MSLTPLFGHTQQRKQIDAAIRQGRLPQLLLITGPEGVGKQRLGLWTAQRLFCSAPTTQGEPCSICHGCRLVGGLSHPDLHWFMPVPRPKATEPSKQVEELEDSIGEVLEERRKDPLYGPPDGLSAHFVATARLIGRRAAMRPVEGRIKVFLLGYAERLVPQESSPEAANALLKLLEEPPEGTYFILTAVDLEAVLPTIRSRAVRMRLGGLSDDEVRGFLATHRSGLSAGEREQRVARSAGAIGLALAEDPERAKGTQLAMTILESARGKTPLGWEMALKQTPFSARGEFTEALDAMAEILVQASREQKAVAGSNRLNSLPRTRLVAALEKVGEAREMAQFNVNPQVVLAVLSQDLAEIL
jgi:DNA polymerase-3 subunit delta'